MQDLMRNLDLQEEETDSFYQITAMQGAEKTTYNIQDYRQTCRTCKDMEVDAFDTINSKKTYKKGSLMNVPNTGFLKASGKL